MRTALVTTLTLLTLAAPALGATLGDRVLRKGARGSDVTTLQRVRSTFPPARPTGCSAG
jgi:hypothetical protein